MKTTLLSKNLQKIIEVSPSPQKNVCQNKSKRVPLGSYLPNNKILKKQKQLMETHHNSYQNIQQGEAKERIVHKIEEIKRKIFQPKNAYQKRTNAKSESVINFEKLIVVMIQTICKISKNSQIKVQILKALLNKKMGKYEKVKIILGFVIKWVSSIMRTVARLANKKNQIQQS